MSRAKRRKAKRAERAGKKPSPEPSPSPQSLAALVSLAGLSALWALFQWTELVVARTGGESFCGFAESDRCSQLWDSPVASAVQDWTALPVAAWGLVWSLVAFALPLWTLVRRSQQRSFDGPWSATLLTGLAGGLAVLVLLASTLLHGFLCDTCALSYLLAGAYMVIGLLQTPLRRASLARGILPAAGCVALAFALLVYPGLRTPRSAAAQGRALLEQITQREGGQGDRGTAEFDPGSAGTSSRATREDLRRRDERIAEVIENLSPQLKQEFADALASYTKSPQLPMRPPRALVGAAEAPVRITEFVDSLCSHCATMHEVMSEFQRMLPPGTFSMELRQFPLDPSCNPAVGGESKTPVRCFAAKAQICLERQPEASAFTASLFANRHELDREWVLRLAEPFIPRERLEACVASPATAARLADDIEWALEHDIVGTPLILVNGRKVDPLGPLVYALILTRGESSSPAFDALPAPTPGLHTTE